MSEKSFNPFAVAENPQAAKRQQAILRYLETRVIGANESVDEREEEGIEDYYKSLGPREKADILYSKLMAYTFDKQVERQKKKEAEDKDEDYKEQTPDPHLISEIKVLFNDEKTKDLFVSTYGEARTEADVLRNSDIMRLWDILKVEIERNETAYKQLEKDLYLGKITGAGRLSSARSRLARLANDLTSAEERKKELESLRGFEVINENTDAAALLQFESLQKYKHQLDSGFVWLPTRKKIHQETISAILNHRWPVLIGEAGSGKSDQADAAALELTGYLPTEIECEASTGEVQLIKDNAIDAKTGGSYEAYGPLMKAFTGYDNSMQNKPTVTTGRIARFDESGRLGPKAYSIIKKVRQKHIGDDFYGHPVLPGAGAIWTSNPVGSRYPDRRAPDPAMRRELAEIKVDYPDNNLENPEIFEFSLAALFDENSHINIAKEELAPAYNVVELDEDQQYPLDDGKIVTAKSELIADASDSSHGALWRFSNAIHALQESFVCGNSTLEKYPDSILRYSEDADGNMEVTKEGDPLTLSTSTVTLGELASWMKGFNERRQKQDEKFRVNTLTEWLNFKIKTYLKQADKADKSKIEAIFKHFHFLEDAVPNVDNVKPLTPKEIGYLSPRVPRPLQVKEPVAEVVSEPESKGEQVAVKEYTTRKVLLEDGKFVLLKERDCKIGRDKNIVSLEVGRNFTVGDVTFTFAGVVEDEKSPQHSLPLAHNANGEQIYRVFDSKPEEWEKGMYVYDAEELLKSIEKKKERLMKCWEASCVNNTVNNPDNVDAPKW